MIITLKTLKQVTFKIEVDESDSVNRLKFVFLILDRCVVIKQMIYVASIAFLLLILGNVAFDIYLQMSYSNCLVSFHVDSEQKRILQFKQYTFNIYECLYILLYYE